MRFPLFPLSTHQNQQDSQEFLVNCYSNILEQLGSNDNIVRYYERFVDKPNNMLYILMEYCEGGDLAGVIQRCRKTGSVISSLFALDFLNGSNVPCWVSIGFSIPLFCRCLLPEDVVWAYLTQITLALHDCHSEMDLNGKRKPVILHRDIKPENGKYFLISSCVNPCELLADKLAWYSLPRQGQQSQARRLRIEQSYATSRDDSNLRWSEFQLFLAVSWILLNFANSYFALSRLLDTLLHVAWTHQRPTLRCQIRYLGSRLSDLRTLRWTVSIIQIQPPRNALCWSQFLRTVRLFMKLVLNPNWLSWSEKAKFQIYRNLTQLI